MIIRGSELIGLEIKNKNNQYLGYSVQDIIYARKGYYVAGLLLKCDLLKKENLKKCKVICFNKIIDLDNAIITQNDKSIMTLEQRPDLKEMVEKPIKLMDFEIYTHDKELVGVVKDTLINKNNGRITALLLSQGLFTDLFEGYSLLSLENNENDTNCVSKDKIIISGKYMDSIHNCGGGLKNIFSIDRDN